MAATQIMRAFLVVIAFVWACCPALSQTAGLRGQITDETGAVVPGVTVTLSGPNNLAKTATSGNDGRYAFTSLPTGDYSVQAGAAQLALPQAVKVLLKGGVQTLNLELKVAATQQQLTVRENPGPSLSTESANNASAMVLRGKDLDALADDPEDLAADLQALAGPAAGPGGAGVYIDGFTGGQLPPKDAIREIRINQNPFSPEYDKLGFGRIEILTKPGADKLHGTGYYNFGDSVWNSRNPYAAQKAPFLLKEYGGSVEGPLNHRASFFLTADRAAIDNGAIINGTILDPNALAIIDPYTQVFRIPQRRIRISPRVDYQLTANDTLSVRYQFADADIEHSGVGGFNLVSSGIHNHGTDQTAQIANTLILGSNALNETRFQFYRARISSNAEDPGAQLDVLNSFIGGGAQAGNSLNTLNSYEFQNNGTITCRTHVVHFGIRVRAATIDNISPVNFGGTFTFAGGLAPALDAGNKPVLDSSGQPLLTAISSIESYRRTLLFQKMGLPSGEIRALGGGASQFTINAGDPSLSVDQEDVGAFVGDTWRVKPNLTLDYGIRYEWQTNLHDRRDFAPRLGFAWAPRPGKSGAAPLIVIRAGFGMFYQRFDIVNVLTASRYNGSTQQQYVITNPDFFPSIPSISALSSYGSQQSTERISSNLRSPYLIESALAVERQLPGHTTASVTYVNSHGVHQFLTNDINAPLPGTYNPQLPGSGVHPLGNPNAVFLVESAGLYNQNELIFNVNSKVRDSVSLFGSYLYNRALSNTDYSPPPQNTDFNPAIGFQGFGVGSFPANPYTLAGEYGPASTDIRNQVTFGGSFEPKWDLRLSPLFVADSGAPFDITVGHDLYGTTLFNGRPGIATDLSRPGLIKTAYGLLDPNPTAGEAILPRNYGRGPGIIMLNLRVSKVFAFGPGGEGSISTGGRRQQTGPFSTGSSGNSVSTNHRYNLSISLSIRNLLNHNNPGPIIGNITSPRFGVANQPYGTGSLGGTGFSESADNRRLELQARFTF